MRRRPLIFAVLVAACHEPIEPDPTDGGTPTSTGAGAASPGESFVAGERLQRLYLDAADGTIAHLGWWDSELETECAFGTASDDRLRCLPTADAVGIHFRDAECTEPIYVGSCRPRTKFVHERVDDGCSAGARVFRLGSPEAPPDEVFRVVGGACAAAPISPDDFVVGVTSEVEPSAMLEATRRTESP